MLNSRTLQLSTLILVLLLPGVGEAETPGKLLPSEATTLMVTQAMNNPDASRKDVYEHYLPRVITEGLDSDELFYLGEVYFFALMPEEARDAYYPLLNDNSMRARVAWQRILQIRFRAFQMYDRVARDMVNFRKNFPADPADRTYLSRQVLNFGNYYREQGLHQKVVDVVEDELAALNYDGAYASFIHPATFIESYAAVGKTEQALAHLKGAHEGLSRTLQARQRQAPEKDHNYPLPDDRYYFFFTPVNEKLGWRQQNDKFQSLIDELASAIARMESM